MLKDEFNRVINYLRISVTDRCNLRCRYCVDGALPFIPHDDVLRYEEIIRFVRIAAGLGVSKVRITGGEPLVRKGIPFLLSEISAVEGITDVALTTNGVYLGRMVQDLKDAGLRRVNISLDSLKKERFAYITGVDAFDEVLASVEKAIYAGLDPIKINTVIIRGFNDDEILDFARFAVTWGVEVRFIEFMPFGDSTLWDRSKIVHSQEAEAIIRAEHAMKPFQSQSRGPAKVFAIDGKGRVGFISPISTHICGECNRIRLTSGGMVRPCLFSDTEYDVKGLLRGDAEDSEVADLLRGVVKAKPERKRDIGQIKKCQHSLRGIGG
jgi:GTP 3',8-cyclase